MKFRYPSYYEKFQCVADCCEDTCCAGWEIDIDDKSYEYYMSVEGEFGERLRANIKEYEPESEDVYEQHGFVLQNNRRCPFLDEHNLCDIYRQLGEEALCDVCTDTPRNYLEYGGAREVSLSASCAEVGRLIYGDDRPISFVEKEIEGQLDFEENEDELLLAEQVRLARDNMIGILQNREMGILARIKAYLACAEEVQHCLNTDSIIDIEKINWDVYLHNSTTVEPHTEKGAAYRLFLSRLRTFIGMDSISEEWESMLQLLQERYVEPIDGADCYAEEMATYWARLESESRLYEYEHLLVYYSFLCLARSVDDYDFLAKAKMAVISFLMIRDIDCALFSKYQSYSKEDRISTARVYAKEVEHSAENMEYLADEILFEDMYTVENLCASLTIV